MQEENKNWPKYNMIVDGESRWVPIYTAGVLYACGWASVKIGGQVLDENGLARDITSKERQEISYIADEYSASK